MLPLSTVLNVSVASIPQGLANYSLGNLLLVSTDGVPASWGTSTYGIYYSPDQVLTDFGSSSETYLQAVSVFSQQPNILSNQGGLIVYPGQTDLRNSFQTFGTGLAGAPFFSGIISTTYPASGTWAQLAAEVQSMQNKILFLTSGTYADVAGAFTTIKNATSYNTRCIYYGGTAQAGRILAAAYASRLLGTNLEGSLTAITMQFKNLSGITVDETITSTILSACAAAGVDTYIDIAGVSMVYSSGGNRFADQVYNQIWLVNSLQVAAFNALQGVANKIPQTEDGMNLFKSALRIVLKQGIINGYLAPGTWTSPTTFGVQEDFISNILQYGFYIYSAPVGLQSTANRNARIAPTIQIACKEAGAIHSGNILVYINP
jgi:hypothetical protein